MPANLVGSVVVTLGERPDGFEVTYVADGKDSGEIRVSYPAAVGAVPPGSTAAIGLVAAVYLGQLCLAEELRLDFAVSEEAVRAVAPLADMLYDIRRWKDDLPPGAGPAVSFPRGPNHPVARADDADRALLLWSGGKDSTLSALTLAERRTDQRAVHFVVNSGVEREEAQSVTRLSSRLGLDLLTVRVDHPQFLEFSSRYATNWNRPPLCNTVPFGRDMLLALLAVPVAASTGSRFLSMGHDRECRTAYVDFHGRRVPRNDVESAEGSAYLGAFIDSFALRGARLLGPVSHLSELQILRCMLVGRPDLMRLASFCFWGGNCGQCAKCLRYYLAQRLFKADVLQFAVNPLSANGAPELDDVLDLERSDTLFQNQVLYCMGRLVERGDMRDSEVRLRHFSQSVLYPVVRDRLDAWEASLMADRVPE